MKDKGFAKTIVFLLIMCSIHIYVLPQIEAEQPETMGRVKYKAVDIVAPLVYNISKHVVWPDSVKFDDHSKPFVIGIFASPGFQESFIKLFGRKKIKNRTVIIKPILSKNDLEGIHLLFLVKKGEQDLSPLISWVADKPVLIIGFTRESAMAGVHVNIIAVYDNKTRFSKNILVLDIPLMREQGFRASSHLLRAAVRTTGDIPVREGS